MAVLGVLGAVPVALWALRSAPHCGFAIAAMALATIEATLVVAVTLLAALF